MPIDTQTEQAFVSWMDSILAESGDANPVAYNFNLYEHVDGYAVQLIGAARYAPDDPSWPCDEVFTSGENLFYIPRAAAGETWQEGLNAARSLVQRYLGIGTLAPKLTRSRAVGIGFVNGDLEIIYGNEPAGDLI